MDLEFFFRYQMIPVIRTSYKIFKFWCHINRVTIEGILKMLCQSRGEHLETSIISIPTNIFRHGLQLMYNSITLLITVFFMNFLLYIKYIWWQFIVTMCEIWHQTNDHHFARYMQWHFLVHFTLHHVMFLVAGFVSRLEYSASAVQLSLVY